MAKTQIGIIGGSGLDQIEGMSEIREVTINTPFGKPSAAITLGQLEGKAVAFLPRHGKGHFIYPTAVPVRANIYALKSLGVERIISVSAVGSLKEELPPMDIVVPDQIIDRTKGRDSTFFSDGIVVHIAFADPFCPNLSHLLSQAGQRTGANIHEGGIYLAMEGPQYSTRAESELYRSWGASIIGMTAIPEAKLAREAEICYATLASVTDFDCWHPRHDSVTTEMIIGNLQKGIGTAKKILKAAIADIPAERTCACGHALKDAIASAPESISRETKDSLKLLLGKYLQ